MIRLVREKVSLGFWKVGLQVFGYGIRVHIWTKPIPDHTPHDHAWTFVSIPLWGVFREVRWNVFPSVRGRRRFLYVRAAGPGTPLVDSGASDALTVRGVHLRWPLMPYRCSLRKVHSFWPRGAGFHMSLVFAGRPRLECTRVWPRPEKRGER